MNTSAVARLLNVSHSTIQRWVSQLNMEVERNQLGHYQFSEEDIALLRKIQNQLNEGIILQKVSISENKIRKATVAKNPDIAKEHEQLIERVVRLENGLKTKADDVVSYQLLQHRSEMEEMHKLVKKLEARIEALETPIIQPFDYFLAAEETAITKKTKKRPFMKMIFGNRQKNASASCD
ncbi:MerR family transcriptional regulator [Peribacillus sp. SI8-4]|uniref:MerR family transcriptional regulator n=1 Tax=Peribacillus sp. SI8-4 TaxID=3048009 RepID=UPI00255754CC|nr:MerR family transcriptional regulator [Peribacillus sp. SI8-4]